MHLGQANIGGRVRVLGIAEQSAEMVSRLHALGVFPGTDLRILRRAPLGDPLQVKAGHTLLSIRKEEAAAILVEEAELLLAEGLQPEVA
jgi:ferrous iron transport protein A